MQQTAMGQWGTLSSVRIIFDNVASRYTLTSLASQRCNLKRRFAKSAVKMAKRHEWQLQHAKAQFSELFRRARAEGPQIVTRQGKESVVVLPKETFESLTARARQPRDLVEFFAQSPLAKVHLDLERTPDYGREIEL